MQQSDYEIVGKFGFESRTHRRKALILNSMESGLFCFRSRSVSGFNVLFLFHYRIVILRFVSYVEGLARTAVDYFLLSAVFTIMTVRQNNWNSQRERLS